MNIEQAIELIREEWGGDHAPTSYNTEFATIEGIRRQHEATVAKYVPGSPLATMVYYLSLDKLSDSESPAVRIQRLPIEL